MHKKNIFSTFLIAFALLLSIALATAQAEEHPESMSNIYLDIPENYREISAGEELLASIRIINLGRTGRIDVILSYEIVDMHSETILSKRETVAIETQANFVRQFQIPDNALPGKYNLQATLTFADGQEATAESSFAIRKNRQGLDAQAYIIIVIIAVLALIILAGKAFLAQAEKIRLRMKIRRLVKKKLKK